MAIATPAGCDERCRTHCGRHADAESELRAAWVRDSEGSREAPEDGDAERRRDLLGCRHERG